MGEANARSSLRPLDLSTGHVDRKARAWSAARTRPLGSPAD